MRKPITHNLKLISWVFLAVALIGLFSYQIASFYKNNNHTFAAEAEGLPSTKSKTNEIGEQSETGREEQIALVQNENVDDIFEKNLKPSTSSAEVAEYEQSIGVFKDKQLIRQYKSYSPNTLAQMANEGDMLASQILGDIALRHNDFKVAAEFYWKAVVYGSREDILNLAVLHERKRVLSKAKGNKEAERDALISSIAWHHLRKIRGENIELDRIYEKFEFHGYIITPEIQEDSKKLAEYLYQQLKNQRASLGYEKFVNQVPPDMQGMKVREE